jgi:ATP-dependent exoDNAse (exonuclease V) beta subunit
MSAQFTLYRSSAGSGKTYALVRQYIRLALTGDEHGFRPRYFRHILAITFTNKAAAEMKERVLTFLKDLEAGKGAGEAHSFFSHVQEDTGLSAAEVKSRSQKLLKAILHHYADLSISTIDKFVYRIVRTFAHDLEMSQGFEIEMDQEQLIQPVVSLLISRVGTDKELSEALLAFALRKAEEGKSYQLEQDLAKFAKHLFQEEADVHIQSLKTVGVKDCLAVKEKLDKEMADFEEPIQQLGHAFQDFVREHQLVEKSFFQGDFYRYMTQLPLMDSEKLFPGKRLKESMEKERWYAKSCPEEMRETIDAHSAQLATWYEEVQAQLQRGFRDYIFNKLLSKNIYSIAVLNELLQELEAYKESQNIKHISEFNKAISDIIRQEPVPFIYERLGERYRHFLLDEFQDTSVMQWHNLLPLMHHALSMGKENLIVGDAKQSIYRWRGGEVEQFVKLPQEIHRKELLPNSEEVEAAIQRSAKEEKLNSNWRSTYEVVDFNNRFFESLKHSLPDHLKEIYEGHEQIPQGKKGGLVHIDLTEKSDDLRQEIMHKIIARAKELQQEQGYAWKDMAVLCRTRKDTSEVAFYLNQAGLKVVSDEALLLSTSAEVNFVLALLKQLYKPKDQLSAVSIVKYLHLQERLSKDIHAWINEAKGGLSPVWEAVGVDFKPHSLWILPLYDLVERLIQLFELPAQDVYLQFFLDAVLKFSLKKGNDVADFLDWWTEQEEKEAIVVPADVDAIKVMTVHKSKGLEFPVVFLPFNWRIGKGASELWVDAQGKIAQMKVALLPNSSLLEKSAYAQDREQEQQKALLDDLNVLYVAMTRPKQQLYIYTEQFKKEKENKLNSLSKLIEYVLGEEHFPYQEGAQQLQQKKEKEAGKKSPYELSYEKTVDWRASIQLKNNAQQLWDVELDRKEWGSLLHQALAKIHYLGDQEAVLLALQRDGLMSQQMKSELSAHINSLLSHEAIRPFFAQEWEVLTEREILDPSGDAYIPDRILIQGKRAQIIDYKTGVKKTAHEQQINTYAGLLQQMGYAPIEKYLIYTETPEVIKV